MSTGYPEASVALSAPVHAAGVADVAAQLMALFGTHVAPLLAALLATLLAPLLALFGRGATPVVLRPEGTLHLSIAIPRGRGRRLALRGHGECSRGKAEQKEKADGLLHGCIVGPRSWPCGGAL